MNKTIPFRHTPLTPSDNPWKDLRNAIRLIIAERLLAWAFSVMPEPEKIELARVMQPVYQTWADRYDPQ